MLKPKQKWWIIKIAKMKRVIVIVVVLIGMIGCSRPIHKKRKRCNGGWYKNRNLSSIDSIQKPEEIISYQHYMVSYPHLYVYPNNMSK